MDIKKIGIMPINRLDTAAVLGNVIVMEKNDAKIVRDHAKSVTKTKRTGIVSVVRSLATENDPEIGRTKIAVGIVREIMASAIVVVSVIVAASVTMVGVIVAVIVADVLHRGTTTVPVGVTEIFAIAVEAETTEDVDLVPRGHSGGDALLRMVCVIAMIHPVRN